MKKKNKPLVSLAIKDGCLFRIPRENHDSKRHMPISPVFIAALFTIARTWKQPKFPSTEDCIKKTWDIYTTEYYWAIKWKEAACNVWDLGSIPGLEVPWRGDRLPTPVFLGFPGGSDSKWKKESACNLGNLGSIPGLRRSPGEGRSNPLQYSCLENPMDREPGGLQSMGSQSW